MAKVIESQSYPGPMDLASPEIFLIQFKSKLGSLIDKVEGSLPQMSIGVGQTLDCGYEIIQPEVQTSPLVFASPHSGTDYPQKFLEQTALSPNLLRSSEDSFVDQLFGSAVDCGAPVIKALFPRAYIDVNREPYELDPTMFEDELPSFANTTSSRVALGLGTIAKMVSTGAYIYREPLSWQEAEQRIEDLYFPYHARLKQLLVATRARFGLAVLIDCHSMPSTLHLADSRSGPVRKDIVLGDRFGTSCSEQLTDLVDRVLSELGYDVVRNDPYSGGFTTQNYGRPSEGLHALQIELNRRLYMDEKHFRKTSGYTKLSQHLKVLAKRIAEGDLSALLDERQQQPAAAE